MQFLYQPLTWGFFLVFVPLAIHLINLMRHRRIPWAAMEFLLASYRKHRKWVWLKQWLLLAMRMVAIATIVAMLAQLVTKDQWTRFFGGKTIHHIVLLDDSFSMSDRTGGTSAFDRASLALGQIARQPSDHQSGPQTFTLLRFSQASKATDPDSVLAPTPPALDRAGAAGNAASVAGGIADFSAVLIDANFDLLLEEKRRAFDVTELAVGPEPALALAERLIGASSDEQAIVYIVSDFRATPWENPEEIRQLLRRIHEAGARIHLMRCVDRDGPNLAVTKLEPAEGTRAAGVPLFVDVTVKNFGPTASDRVQLHVRSSSFPDGRQALAPATESGQVDELPIVLIDRIEPGQALSRRVQVYFPTAGEHRIEAELPADAVAADNRRWCVVDFPADIPVLVIDGDPAQRHAYFLSAVFQPSQRAKTGIRPLVEPPTFLRDVSAEVLRTFRAVYLMNVERLEPRAREFLEEYVRQGGGVAFFLGPDANVSFYNQWYAEGLGLFPVPLDRQDLLAPHAEDAPDLIVSDHPVFRVLSGEQNRFAEGIRIHQYFRTPAGWSAPDDSTIRTLAVLRDRQPLVVERQFGEGRVVTFLTTLAPDWNNWARQPSFVVMALELQAYLQAPHTATPDRQVGTPIDLVLSRQEYRGDVTFVAPGRTGEGRRRVIQLTARSKDENSPVMTASLGHRLDALGGVGETDLSGVYEALPMRLDGEHEVRRFALNVDTRESDLALVSPAQLASKLEPVRVEIHEPDQLAYAPGAPSGFAWSQLLLVGLIGLLLGEQLLAYSASYHPARKGQQ
jgi:hypothetical protein